MALNRRLGPHMQERKWLFGTNGIDMNSGGAVVVSLDTERLPGLPTWQTVTQILDKLTIGVVAAHAL